MQQGNQGCDRLSGALVARDEISKGGRGRTYRLARFVCDALIRTTEGRAPDEPLFVDDRGNRLTTKTFDRPDRPDRPPPSRVWFRLLTDAGVAYRGVHNLRRSAVSVLAKENATMEKITSVTGQTVEVARECYLTIDAETQRQTMEKLSSIYGLDRPEEPARNSTALPHESSFVTLRLQPPEAMALTRQLVLRPDSGKCGVLIICKPMLVRDRKSWRRGEFSWSDNRVSSACPRV